MPETVEIPPSPKAAEFLEKLRDQTSGKHKELESTRLSLSLLNSEATAADYRRYLEAMAAILAYTEANIFPVLSEAVSDLEDRRKLSAISEDLLALAHVDIGHALPRFNPHLDIHSIAYNMGFMYVIEGSVLGGRVILKQLQKNERIQASAPHRYFNAYGEQTGKMWKGFLSMLTAPEILTGNEEEIIKGANDAFSCIKNYFEKVAQ